MSDTEHLFLDAFKTMDLTSKLTPGRPQRDWMDQSANRHAYRCLPLGMANSTGWEMVCPMTVDIQWNGKPEKKDIKITSPDNPEKVDLFAQSHFRQGIVTFHTGYLFRTPKGWATWCMGPPNLPKHGIYPLSGLVETDWLPFPFTMNWQMTRPGKVRFKAGEPFCFITLQEHRRLEEITPKIKKLSSDPVFEQQNKSWSTDRQKFNDNMEAGDKKTKEQGWQRHYMQGSNADANVSADDHDTKRRLKNPVDVTGSALLLG